MECLSYVLVLIIALCLGSFLNVVIYRLPRELSLALPRSYCHHCRKTLQWHHNIPVLSFLLLKGRCAFCHHSISLIYPIVEILTGLTGIFLFWKFGLTLTFAATCLFSLIMIALVFIDIAHQLLPDILTLSLLWLGLIASLFPIFTDSHSAIMGAVAGYLSLWSVAKLYEAFTGHEGMGHGDFKLLAALGAWVGFQPLITIILIASLTGSLVAVFLLIRQKAHRKTPIAFGPFLAIAGSLYLFFFMTPFLQYSIA